MEGLATPHRAHHADARNDAERYSGRRWRGLRPLAQITLSTGPGRLRGNIVVQAEKVVSIGGLRSGGYRARIKVYGAEQDCGVADCLPAEAPGHISRERTQVHEQPLCSDQCTDRG